MNISYGFKTQERREQILDFVLDGVGLHAEKLQLTDTECARKRNRFWLGLGNDDETRTKTLDKLSEARLWNGIARVAIGRALADVRAYNFYAD
ncbi:unnamed protein product [Cylicocyclus nassatus]|uniref:Uncharacterized protein n=1 Tax=Cylicocyclus nassatus TaxID=53992 RepID=A0AA36M8F1_CYLNA|nr:unnamed protein product [Cylicocyclus nassatus]